MKIIIKTGLILFTLVLLGCRRKVEPVYPGGSSPDFSQAQGVSSRWSQGSFPLELKYSDAFLQDSGNNMGSGGNLNVTGAMAEKWDQAISFNAFRLPFGETSNMDSAGSLDDFRDNVLGIYKSFSWYGDVTESALAVTQFFAIPQNVGTSFEYFEIVHADIMLNYRSYDFSVEPRNYAYDLKYVLIHELGHLLGLSHNWDSSKPSVMKPTLGLDEVFSGLTPYDVSTVQGLYSNTQLLTAEPEIITSYSRGAGNENDRYGPSSRANWQDNPNLVRGIIEMLPEGICQIKLGGKTYTIKHDHSHHHHR